MSGDNAADYNKPEVGAALNGAEIKASRNYFFIRTSAAAKLKFKQNPFRGTVNKNLRLVQVKSKIGVLCKNAQSHRCS